jgi:peptide/nickel transport system permease protein
MSFRKYIARRVVVAILALLIALTINFVLFRVFNPMKDPTMLIIADNFPESEKERLRVMWGLNEPMYVQYFKYLYNMATWQFGLTLDVQPKPVIDELRWRMVNSLSLLAVATVLEAVIGISLGVYAASKRGKKVDVFVTSSGLFASGTPEFFLQLTFIFVFATVLHIFPEVGVVSLRTHSSQLDLFIDVAYHAALPIITLTLSGLGFWAMWTRNLMVDVMTEDYMLTALAKGVKGRVLLFSHAFRTIVPQVATVMVTLIPRMLFGSVVTEVVFSWPGIGQWFMAAIMSGNHPVAQAITWIYMFISVMGFLLMDILYGWLDPRIRVGTRR